MSAKVTGTAKFTLDPKNPPTLSERQKARLAALPDSGIEFTGIPPTHGVPWKRPGALAPSENTEQAGTSETGRAIIRLAQQHGVSYEPTAADAWARDITRLGGDDLVLDHVELLLIALQRAGHLSRKEALRLQVNYLREARL